MPEDDLAIDWTPIVAERKIKDAIEQGVFDNLPGKGKPLNLEQDALTPPHLRTTHRILRNAGVAPEWILIDKEITTVKAEADQLLARAEERWAIGNYSGIDSLREQYHKTMKEANNLILKYNMAMPSNHRGPIPFRIKERLAKWDELFKAAEQ